MSLDVLNLLLVLIAALGGGWLANRFGYPAILGELFAGIVLGPPLLGILGADDALTVIGKLGVILLMLYIGLHLDPADIGRAAKPGALAAAGGFLVPAVLGFALMMVVTGDAIASTFVAVAMGVTSLATKSRILADLGILNTRVAHVLMAGALFSDIAALIIFAAVLGLAATGAIAVGGVMVAVLKALVFLGVTWLVGTRVFPIIGRYLAARSVDTSTVFLLVVIASLGLAALADAAGLHAILGAFLAGLYIREGVLDYATLKDVESKTRLVSVGLLAPVFFVIAGFKVSFDVFTDEPLLLAAVIVVATVGKIVGTALFYLPTRFGFREGITVGAGMNGRGAVEIIVAEIALAAGLIDATVFSILVFMAIFTTATVPVFLTLSIRWLKRHGELVADERDAVIIVGASPLAIESALLFDDSAHVVLVDSNAAHCAAAEAAGLATVRGSGIDEDVLREAGAGAARVLIAMTANDEVNVLAAKVAHNRFGVPTAMVTVGPTASDTLVALLADFSGQLMFGRRVDVNAWDLAVGDGSARAMSIDTDPDIEATELAQSFGHFAEAMETLPIVVQNDDRTEPFSTDLTLGDGSTVRGIGKPVRVGAPGNQPSMASD